MKKFILSFAIVALIFGGLFACGEQTKWNREERQAMRNLLRDYRKMVYLNDLSEAEYMLFTDQVLASVEEDYPVYTTFIEMPAVNDTVQVYVVTTIVEASLRPLTIPLSRSVFIWMQKNLFLN